MILMGCIICGAVAAGQVRVDPFGKSDRMDWFCTDHMPKLDIYQSSDITSLQAERDLLRATLREAIAAFDRAAIALDAAGDKLAASVATVAIGNARKVLGEAL